MKNSCSIIPQVKNKNGESVDSKLFTDLLSLGLTRESAKHTYAAVRTESFKEWFGDWENDPNNSSELVDENGEPRLFYYMANDRLEDIQDMTIADYEEGAAKGYIFNAYIEDAMEEPNVYPVFLNSRNLVLGKGKSESEDITGDGYIFATSSSTTKMRFEEVAIYDKSNVKGLKLDTHFPTIRDLLYKTKNNDFNKSAYFKSEYEFKNYFLNTSQENLIKDFVIDRTTSPLLKQVANLVLDNFHKLPNLTLRTIDVNDNFAGNFHPDQMIININYNGYKNISKQWYRQTLIHEYIHAFSVYAIMRPETEAEINFKKSVEGYYSRFKDLKMNNKYGLTNKLEFVTEIMTNPKFAEELSNKQPTLWQKIISTIAKLLGINYDLSSTTNSKEVKQIILEFGRFIKNDSNPREVNYTKKERDTINLQNRKESLQASINNYTTRRVLGEVDPKVKTVSGKETFFLNAHKKIIKTLGSLKREGQLLTKQFKADEFEYNKKVREIYNTESQNSPLYQVEADKFDTIKQNYEDAIGVINDQMKSLSNSLGDLDKGNLTDYEAEYMNYATGELARIEASTYNMDFQEDQDRLAEDYNFTRMVINSHEIVGIVDRAKALNEKLMKDMAIYVSKLSDKYLNTSGLEDTKIDVNTILNDTTDISTLSYLFEGFGDYARIETQLIHSITMNGKEKARLKSLDIGKQVMTHMKALEQWGKENGITRFAFNKNLKQGSLRKVYARLVEVSNTGRLDLVKPYSKEYYADVNKNFKKRWDSKSSKAEVDAAKLWLKENYYNKPDRSYENNRYNYIQKQKPLKDFYDFFKATIADGYGNLPEYIGQKNEEKIPSIMRDTVWEFLSMNNGNTWKSISLALKTLLLPTARPTFYDETGKVGTKFTLDELNKDEVRLRMIGEIDPTMKSFDLGKILYEFASFTNDYSEMSKVLPNVRLIQNIAESKKYERSADWDPTGLTKRLGQRGTDSRTYRAIDLYVKNKVLAGGDEGKSFGKIPLFGGKILNENGEVIGENNYFFSDGLRGFIKYTRLLTLGYNPFSAINNVAAGMMADIIEAQGGKNFKKRDLLKAIQIYTGSTLQKKGKMFSSNKEDTKVGLLIDLIQPLQEIGEWQDKRHITMGAPTMVGNVRQHFQEGAFIMQEWGEHFVQTINMIAYLRNQKTASGKSLWDSVQVVDGKLVIDAGIEEQLVSTRDNIRDINNSVHGNYSKDNSSVFENNLLFQSAMVFKKWIPYMIRNRFMAERYNYRTGNTDKGFYLSGANYLGKTLYNTYSTMYNKLQTESNKLMTKKDLTQNELVGIRKIVSEAVILMLLATMKKWLTPPPDESKDSPYIPNWWEHLDISMWDSKQQFNNADGISAMLLKSMMDTSNRLAGEMTQFYSPKFYMNDVYARHALWTTAAQLVTSMKVFGDFLFSNDDDDIHFKRGARKGELKVIKAGTDIIPYIRQIDKTRVNGSKTFAELNY